ncbi:hypothetical protein ACOSQ2_017767 [Xanthoceras sorbifolium]
MVDAIVSFAVQRLGDFLIKEAGFLKGVRSEVQWLRDELRCMQRFLQDAEEKQYGDATISGWVSDIRELAYDIEDLLDTFHLKIHSEGGDDDDGETTEEKPQPGCFPSMSCCLIHKAKEKVDLYNIGKEIEEFKNKLNDLSRRRQLYGLQASGNNREGRTNDVVRSKELRRATSFAVEQNVVGFDDEAIELLAKLFHDDPRRFIVSIYGMGGLGKTTLAGKLYHNSDVQRRFMNCCAWVSVSQDYTTQDLLVRLIKSFGFGAKKIEDLEKMDEADLGRYLHKSLQGRSYLLVIDDVWDKEAWKGLRRVFPDNKNGSRVIITTRNKEIAESADERTYAHKLRYLRPDESWQLFCEKAFQNFVPNEELKKLGREMVQKCKGLPLAIIVLGGLLSRKKPQEWRVVRNHLWQHLKADEIEIQLVLALSFDCLHYTLKQCFLYLGLFPEDFDINMEKLIHLLVAEGFIPQDEDHIMEDVAKDYLDELIDRSLLQVESRKWGRIATCRIHDLLRDLAIEKAKKLNFLYIYDEVRHSNMSSIISSCPRQAVYSATERSLWLQKSNPRLRSLFLFDTSQELVPAFQKFSRLRLFDTGSNIQDEDQQNFSAVIEKLIHLKYLGLRKESLSVLSSFIFNLRRLQTLVIYHYKRVELPDEIGMFQELRHLIGDFTSGPLSISNLTNLQTLKFIKIGYWMKIKTEKLVNLRELWLHGSMEEEVFSFDSMTNLKSLRILSVELKNDRSFGSLQPLSHCQHLVDLKLRGTIKKLPKDMREVLPNLEFLCLGNTKLDHDPMPILEKLPNLMILYLGCGFSYEKTLMCSANGFLGLEILMLDLSSYQTIELQEGALPKLRGLSIPSKLIIPKRLRSLPPLNDQEFSTLWLDDGVGRRLPHGL